MAGIGNWIKTESKMISIVVAVMLISVLGTVGGAIYNAASVNNLSQSVQKVNQVSDAQNASFARTACRTAVQASYDASFSRIILGLLASNKDVPKGLLQDTYSITPAVLVSFERSVQELALLEKGLICVGDTPSRVPPESPTTTVAPK